MLSTILTKGRGGKGNFHDFLLASTDNLNLPIWSLLLTLLHSEGPKLYGVLAVLSAIGLKKRICYYWSSTVVSLESVLLLI